MKLNPVKRHVFLEYAHHLLLKMCTSVLGFFYISLFLSCFRFQLNFGLRLTEVVHTGVTLLECPVVCSVLFFQRHK